ncbi:MAG: Tol-Pal system beta propeller repeat protein TolB [Lysobacter sp.]|nr:Tol-Pal system beta propeller repeat protein TolB [Lysobacter sp.]
MTRLSSAPRPAFPVAAVLALLCLLAPLFAFAQTRGLEIDIVGGNAAALPIAVVPMPYQGAAAAPQTDIAEVVAADLARSGQFRTLTGTGLGTQRPTRGSEIDFGFFQQAKQSYIVVGRVLDAADGSYRVEYELYDIAKNRMLAFALTARANAMRDVAHQIADAIYEKITGVRGAFWTRIAYVVQTGLGKNAQYALYVADADGYNPQTVVRSDKPLMSPAWSPDGRKLAYVSFERGNSSIVLQDIATGARETVSSFKGINGAPSFSPDGSRLAMALSKSGNPEIYVMDLGSRALTQLTNQFGIDTEPTWSADGSRIYFTSDRGGRPQIYQVPASGGAATRVSFQGTYNARATVSSDGKKIAMAQGSGNNYRIALMDSSLGSARWSMLSPGTLDESPSFAPNGGMVLYAAREGRRGVLYAVSADARVRQRLVVSGGDVREPAWGPYRLPR